MITDKEEISNQSKLFNLLNVIDTAPILSAFRRSTLITYDILYYVISYRHNCLKKKLFQFKRL